MSKTVEDRLDALMAARGDAQRTAELKVTAEKTLALANIEAFRSVAKAQIVPAFYQFKDMIEKRGIPSRVVATGLDGTPERGSYSVSLELLIDGERDRAPPHFAVIMNGSSKVAFHRSTMSSVRGGSSGGAGQASFAELDVEMLQVKLLELVEAVLKP